MLRTALLTLTVLTTALVAAGCGSSSEPLEVRTSNPPPAPAVSAQPSSQEVKTGSSVGNRVPQFEFSLADGTKVSSSSLTEQAEPAYLFFFATW